MLPSDLIRRVAEFCEQHRIEYFVTGSVASSVYGRYRTTNDVDVVIALPPRDVKAFCGWFPEEEFYVSEEAAREAALEGGMFNVIEQSTQLKIDVIIPRDTPFDDSRIERARRLEIKPGLSVMFGSPEDVILSKLVFYREGGSQKHLDDIGAMMIVLGAMLDRAYIEQWAPRIGVSAEWRLVRGRVCGSAGPAGTS